jgi:Sugar (and other) transporter
MFLSEVAPLNYRGALGTAHQLSITIGILISSILGIPQLLGKLKTDSFLRILILLLVMATRKEADLMQSLIDSEVASTRYVSILFSSLLLQTAE